MYLPQATLEETQAALEAKSAELAALQAQLQAATSDAGSTQQRLQSRIGELEAGLAAAEAAKSAVQLSVEDLQTRLQQLGDSAAAKQADLDASLAALIAELDASNTAKEASARELASVNMRLEIATQEAQVQVGDLPLLLFVGSVDCYLRSRAAITLAAAKACSVDIIDKLPADHLLLNPPCPDWLIPLCRCNPFRRRPTRQRQAGLPPLRLAQRPRLASLLCPMSWPLLAQTWRRPSTLAPPRVSWQHCCLDTWERARRRASRA